MVETGAFVLFGTADLDFSEALGARLRKQGSDVCACASSQEFLEAARRRKPAVVVLDDELESVGGNVLIRLLRTICPTVPVVLLLPPGSKPDRDEQKHLGPLCTLIRPISDQDLGVVISAALLDHGLARPSAAPPVIFCVDDDPLFLKSLVRILRRRGYAVLGFESPESALEGIPIHNPALMFIDVLMPGMNGLDLASELREEYGDAIPFVLLTAKASDQEITDGYRSGARYYITKPCEPDRVLNIADYLVGNLGPREKELLGSKL
jgi:DNA-binding response OmpR family regulator